VVAHGRAETAQMSCEHYTLRQRSYTRGRTIVRNGSASTVPFPSVESVLTRAPFQTPHLDRARRKYRLLWLE